MGTWVTSGMTTMSQEERGVRFRRGERPTPEDRSKPSFDASLWWKDEWRPCGCESCAALLEEYGATRYAQIFVDNPTARPTRAEKNWYWAHKLDIDARRRAKQESERSRPKRVRLGIRNLDVPERSFTSERSASL